MMQVNVLEAKTDFSKLIRPIETNREDEIRVARNGKPIAKNTAIDLGVQRVSGERIESFCTRKE